MSGCPEGLAQADSLTVALLESVEVRRFNEMSPAYFPNAQGKRGRPLTGLERMQRVYSSSG